MAPLILLRIDTAKPPARPLCAALVDLGCEVILHEAVVLAAVEQIILERHISLIVCRAQMPDFSACDVLDLLEQKEMSVPLLVVSENADDSLAYEALRRGAIDCVSENDHQRFAARVFREGICALAGSVTNDRRGYQPQVAHARLLRIASDAAHLGGWMLELPSKRITWSDPVCKIYGVPSGTSPTLEQALSYVAEDWQSRVINLFEQCVRYGQPFDEEIQLVVHERRIWVRIVGEAIPGPSGATLGIQGALQDISAAKKTQFDAEEEFRKSEKLYQNQRAALIELTKLISQEGGEMIPLFQKITERAAVTLNVARVGIWTYVENRESLVCLDVYQTATGEHSDGMTFLAIDHPAYFQALRDHGLVAVDDAASSPLMSEFLETYLKPLGITSLLDVPVHGRGGIDYFICTEHIGPARQWTAPEKTFALAIGNLVALVIQNSERNHMNTRLKESLQRFESVASASNDTIWDWDLRTNSIWWGEGAEILFGTLPKAFDSDMESWIARIHPDDRDALLADLNSVIDSDQPSWSGEYRVVQKCGRMTYVLGRATVIRDANGTGIRMIGGMMDLTAQKRAELELKRSHRALQMLTSCGEMLIRAVDEHQLLADACRLAVEVGGYRMAWIGYAAHDAEKHVKPMAHAGADHGYLKNAVISWSADVPGGNGPVGRCIREGKPIYVDNIEGSFTLPLFLEPALERGYHSIICLPFRDEQSVFGVLCLYNEEAYQTGADEIELLSDMASDLAFGIKNLRTQETAQRMHDVIIKVAQAVSSGTDSSFFDMLTLNMVETCQASGGLIGRFDPVNQVIEAISLVQGGQLTSPLVYPIAGTPFEPVAQGLTCVFVENLGNSFPTSTLVAEAGMESCIGLPLLDEEQKVVGIIAVYLTEPLQEARFAQSTLQIFAVRAAAELARLQSDARIREQASLLDKAQDAISVRDLQHQVTYWNKSAERLFGWTADEVVGCPADQFLFAKPADYHQAFDLTLANGEWVGEINQLDKSGRSLIVKMRWSLVRDALGLPTGILAIDSDVSEYRKLENQFLRAQRLESIGTLAGGMAHDLNNILSPIFMAAELLKMRGLDSRASELLDTIESSAKRGAELVGQVLSFARGQVGDKIPIHPRQLIADIEIIARDTFLNKGYFKISAKPDLWTIMGDPTQLQQILLNLCVNAHDAIAGGGEITISAENHFIDETFASLNLQAQVGPYVCLTVSDTGIGISAAVIEKIFDPFFTTKSGNRNTGLGLSTCLTIAKNHGGFIEVTSTPTQGTSFRVFLPAHRKAAALVQDPPPRPQHSGRGETILVVDDEPAILQMAVQTLQAFGYETLIAENGAVALTQYLTYREEISLVFTDCMMPLVDGFTLIHQLAEINPSVKIIATSGVPANRALADLSGHGIIDFLTKPYTPQALLSSLQQALHEGGCQA